jgi:Regulator of ribonuclease activity B
MEFKDTVSQIAGIREIFADAEREDNWKVDEPMLYSYYFVDSDPDKLESLGVALEEKDYDFIGVFELGDEETDEPTGEYMLHIDKVESHTPESLAQRNVEFAKLAEDYKITTYDGWEFGEEGDYDEDDEDDEE